MRHNLYVRITIYPTSKGCNMFENLKEIISDAELYSCPINEHLRVLDFKIALQILRMDVHNLDNSFLTSMHREMVNHMLQRGSMATHVLFSPNFCAELFTYEQYRIFNRYIINKLVGRYDYDGLKMHDFPMIERQMSSKIYKLAGSKRDDYLIFFWDRQPNLIIPDSLNKFGWKFHSDSPAYKGLVDFYGKHKIIKHEGD